MENVLNNLEINNNYTLIGDKDQVLQILLKKNESVICKKNILYYLSSDEMESIEYHKVNTITQEKERPGVLYKNSNLVRLKNIKNAFEYIGLLNGGKVMKVIPLLYKDLFIRYDSLIAFSDSIELYDIKDVTNSVYRFKHNDNFINADNKFLLLHSKKSLELDKFSVADYHYLKDYVFLSSENMLIEKRLGTGESIMLRKNSLFLFEKSVIFHNEIKQNYKREYFMVEGPGLIIFELNNVVMKKQQALKNARNLIVIIFIFSILSFIPHMSILNNLNIE